MNEYIEIVKEALKPVATDFKIKSEKRVYVVVPKEKIIEAARILFKDLKIRFAIASGIDTPQGIEIMYHFSPDAHNMLVNISVLIKKDDLTIDSITPVVKGAAWIETEIREMLGVRFKNHPGPKHLLLGEDWPEDLHPLRRDNKDTRSTAAIRERLRRDGLLTASD